MLLDALVTVAYAALVLMIFIGTGVAAWCWTKLLWRLARREW